MMGSDGKLALNVYRWCLQLQQTEDSERKHIIRERLRILCEQRLGMYRLFTTTSRLRDCDLGYAILLRISLTVQARCVLCKAGFPREQFPRT